MPIVQCSKFSFPVPGILPGAYTAQLQVDATCKVSETDETNNVKSATYATGLDLSVERLVSTSATAR